MLNYLNFKKLGLIYFISPLILFIYVPLIAYLNIRSLGFTQVAFFQIFLLLEKTIPFTSCLWILFILSDYTESRVSELFYAYKKNAIIDFSLILAWYLLHVLILFFGLFIFVYNYFPQFPMVLIHTLVFSSVSFFLLFLTKTMFVPFLLCLIYQLFVFAFPNEQTMAFNMLYNHLDPTNLLNDPLSYLPLPLFFISLILIALGQYFYKLRR